MNIPSRITDFQKDVGLVTSEGPRWEDVVSYTHLADGTLWICAGISDQSLLKWTKKERYRIATFNNRVRFYGTESLMGSNEAIDDVSISFVLPRNNSDIVGIGETGIYRIGQDQIVCEGKFEPRLDQPSPLLQVSPELYFLGARLHGPLLLKGTELKQLTRTSTPIDL